MKFIYNSFDVNRSLSDINLLTIVERRKLALFKFTYKFRNTNIFKQWYDLTSHANKYVPRLIVPKVHSTTCKRSIKCNTIAVWNELLSKKAFDFYSDEEEFEDHIISVTKYLESIRSGLILLKKR